MDIAGAESYVVQLARDSLFTSKLLDTAVKDVAIEIGPLDGGTRYFRRIRARGPSGESEFGSVTSFSTGTPKGEGSIPGEAPAAYALSRTTRTHSIRQLR